MLGWSEGMTHSSQFQLRCLVHLFHYHVSERGKEEVECSRKLCECAHVCIHVHKFLHGS